NLKMDVQNSQPIFSHNDTALRSHPRTALKKSYLDLCSEVRKIILDNLPDPQKASIFASKIESMFLEKQIAIDEYHGFSGETDLTNTFITMNSKGIDLSPIDLLRAIILDHVLSLKWSEKSIEEMENQFTETFESSEAKNELKV